MLVIGKSRVPPSGTHANPTPVHVAGRPAWCSLVSSVQLWKEPRYVHDYYFKLLYFLLKEIISISIRIVLPVPFWPAQPHIESNPGPWRNIPTLPVNTAFQSCDCGSDTDHSPLSIYREDKTLLLTFIISESNNISVILHKRTQEKMIDQSYKIILGGEVKGK